jgi:DNA-binding HxlR family transcriptional regulator
MKKTAQSYVERDKCPLYTAIRILEGRWKPMIFQRLDRGALGFGELRRSMAGVTTKVLRQQLRQLEADDLVARIAAPKAGFRVHYQVTPHGKTLQPVLECLWTWGVTHLSHMDGISKGLDPRRLAG